MKNRLFKESIFKKKKDIDFFFKNCKKKYGKVINIYYLNVEEGNEKVAFFVFKRIGNAVERNQTKRFLREHYRMNKEKYKKKSLIFITQKKMIKMSDVVLELKRVEF